MEKYTSSWIGRINVVEISALPKGICRFNANPMKTAMAFFFVEREQNPKIWIEPHKILNSQSNPEKDQS